MDYEWKLEDKRLGILFDETSRSLLVHDKRCGKVWSQQPVDESLTLEGVTREGNKLQVKLRGEFILTATIELTEASELSVTLKAEKNASCAAIRFPSAFRTPDSRHAIVQTDSQGLLLPADDLFYPLEEQPLFFCGGGAAMAWAGVVDEELESGYMAIVETPHDAAFSFDRDEDGLIAFAPVWYGTMGEFGYARKVTYVFFDRGGYVAQCKRYRAYSWQKNGIRTLRENEKRFPALEKMLGCVHMYVWDGAREIEFARGLKEAGIEKALILWDANHLPYPEPGYDDRLKELGYGTGAYELFTDIHPDGHAGSIVREDIPLKRNVYPGKFEAIVSRKADGTTYFNSYGTYVCPEAVRPEMFKRVERELEEYNHETYFLDVYQANGLYECHHPEHRLSRQQYAEAILRNCELLEERYGTYLGGEFGADFAAKHGLYAHGMMTLQRTFFGSEITHKGTIHYYGDWKNNPRPSVMLGTRTASDTYLKYAINEYTRVPLYELVYHDAVVTSWRWEDGNHHCPEIWWKKDLFNILYGTAPLWSIDQDRWESFEVNFIESYNNVCPWLEQICRDEMISHRFVSTDRKVQESRFSSGRRAVVNFGENPHEFEGRTVQPRGYITLDN
ncbi:glycoside hydrolase [Paenibacillus glycanilyticus]|uniref:glycoside hydrolase n=1 Tax=Paenibacillus glycanilyticus TaxID=126569 RepID=UPI000FDB7A43|nr:glycoside hydrolase [Paenibacillus glycanilyticus]